MSVASAPPGVLLCLAGATASPAMALVAASDIQPKVIGEEAREDTLQHRHLADQDDLDHLVETEAGQEGSPAEGDQPREAHARVGMVANGARDAAKLLRRHVERLPRRHAANARRHGEYSAVGVHRDVQR